MSLVFYVQRINYLLIAKCVILSCLHLLMLNSKISHNILAIDYLWLS